MKQCEMVLEEDYPDDTDIDYTPIYLIIDELNSLIAKLNNKKKKAFSERLHTIAQRGRATGVNIINTRHMITCLQVLEGKLRLKQF